jgi:inner membrane protein
MLIFSGLAMLPDLDYLGVMLGVPDAGPCGHRGATHSLIPPLVVALLVAAFAPRLGMRVSRWRLACLAGLVVASHALLDAMTVTSRGVPLLWPISFTRFEMPWRPIPNAPCGLAFVSIKGLHVACVELVFFLPVLVASLWPPRARKAAQGPAPGPAESAAATRANSGPRPIRITHGTI